MRSACLLILFLASVAFAAEPGPARLLRFPDIHGDRVVFSSGGDLWTASTSGGTAVRLTSHPGLELFGKFSPDGRSIAFRVSARDEHEEIGSGTHTRVVVNVAKFDERVKRKLTL